MQEEIKVKCNRCDHGVFKVIKNDMPLPEDSPYFSCSGCIRERNRALVMQIQLSNEGA
jgi:hypothetical protein